MKTIIIIGGGVGGIVTANELSTCAYRDYKIILIEKNNEHTFAPSYLWVMTGERSKSQVSVPLKSLLNKRVELIISSVDEIIPGQKLFITLLFFSDQLSSQSINTTNVEETKTSFPTLVPAGFIQQHFTVDKICE